MTIELKNYLDIPADHFIEVSPVRRGGWNDTLFLQQMTLYRVETRTVGFFKKKTVHCNVKVYQDYIFLNEDGTRKYDDEIAFSDIRKLIASLGDSISPPPGPVRVGRHP